MTGSLPEGFLLREEFLSAGEEASLIEFISGIGFGEVRMHGVTAKRRVAQFGWRYAFESFRLTPGPPVPPELVPIRERAAAVAEIEATEFSEALVTQYPPGAGIGWHRDAPHFGIVAGVSLGSAMPDGFSERGWRGTARCRTAGAFRTLRQPLRSRTRGLAA